MPRSYLQVLGFVYREHVMHAINPAAYDFLLVVIPVVSIFGPLGALLSSFYHRLVRGERGS